MLWYIVIILATGQAQLAYDGGTMRPFHYPTRQACQTALMDGTKPGSQGVIYAFCTQGRDLRLPPVLDGKLVLPPLTTIPAPPTLPSAPEKK
jgi:hypothetical protein